jgi:hypothetical protein
MAKYKNGIQGQASGKIGNVVASSYRGVDYLRSLPGPSSKQPSAAQVKQRSQFAMVNGWLKPIRDIINIGFQIKNDSRTPMNLVISHTLIEALDDGKIDFSKAIFSRGALCISFITEVTVLSNAVLYIKWRDAASSAYCKAEDKATFVIYNPVKELFVTFEDVAVREEKEVMLQLPRCFIDDEVFGWMHYVNTNGSEVSTSVYIGKHKVIPVRLNRLI